MHTAVQKVRPDGLVRLRFLVRGFRSQPILKLSPRSSGLISLMAMMRYHNVTALMHHDDEPCKPGPTAGVARSRYRPVSAPVASAQEAAAAQRVSAAITAATIFSGHACLQPGPLPFIERPGARLSGGLRASPTACGWADRHHRHGAPLAQAPSAAMGQSRILKLMTRKREHDLIL